MLWLGAHTFIMDSITENNLPGCPANCADLISVLQQCHHQNSLSEKGMGQLLMSFSAFQLISIYLLAPGVRNFFNVSYVDSFPPASSEPFLLYRLLRRD